MNCDETPFVEFDDELAILTLNRPNALNALSFTVLDALSTCIDEVESSDARAVLIVGQGERAFCAGADIKELRNRTMQEQRQGVRRGQALFERLARLSTPSVAVINGYAFGGGLEMALACTFRLATPNAVMGQPEIKLGLIPGYGGTQRLPRLIGEARALELVLTGRNVDAEEALRIGLVHRIVDPDRPLVAAKEFAQEFCQYSRPVLQFAREAVTRAADSDIVDGLRIEADLATLAFQTQDAEEGMAAFEQKRKARFTDS